MSKINKQRQRAMVQGAVLLGSRAQPGWSLVVETWASDFMSQAPYSVPET